MLKVLKQKIWWFAISLAGASQHGAAGAGAAALVAVPLLGAIAHSIWLSFRQLWRDRQSATGPTTVRFRTRPANSQERRHACP
jgi:hypothetical protein